MQLEEFYDYKNQLMGDILTNKDIVSLLNSDIELEDAAELAYTHVNISQIRSNMAKHLFASM